MINKSKSSNILGVKSAFQSINLANSHNQVESNNSNKLNDKMI